MNINFLEKIRGLDEKNVKKYEKHLKPSLKGLDDVKKGIEHFKIQQKKIATNVHKAYNLSQELAEEIPGNAAEMKNTGKSGEDLFKNLKEQKNNINQIAFKNQLLLADNFELINNTKKTALKNIGFIDNIINKYKDGKWKIPKVFVKYCKETRIEFVKNLDEIEKAFSTTKNDYKINKNLIISKMFDEFTHPAYLRKERSGTYVPKYLKDYMFAKQRANLICFDDTSKRLSEVFENDTKNIMTYERKGDKTSYKGIVEDVDLKVKKNPKLYDEFLSDVIELQKNKKLFNNSINNRIKETQKLLSDVSQANQELRIRYLLMFQKPSLREKMRNYATTTKTHENELYTYTKRNYSDVMFDIIIATQTLKGQIAAHKKEQSQDLTRINNNYIKAGEHFINVIENKDARLETTNTKNKDLSVILER